MRTWIVAGVLGALVMGVALTVGCNSAQWQVAGDNVKSSIDSMLGTLEVKEKEIENKLDALEKSMRGIREARIKAKVRVDQIAKQVEPHKQNLTKYEDSLARLRDKINSGDTVVVNDKEYTKDEMNALAQKVLAKYKDEKAKIEGLTAAKPQLERVVDQLANKEDELKNTLADLKTQLSQIKAKALALKEMKKASAAMGAADESLAENVEGVQNDINELFAEVETGLQMEDAQWSEFEKKAESEIDDVDAFINSGTPDDTLSEIDAILGQ